MSQAVYLLEVQAWTGAGVETLRLASRTKTTGPGDTPANTVYRGLIDDPGSFKRSISVDGGTFGRGGADVGFIDLNNRAGSLDAWLGYGYGRTGVLKEIADIAAPVSSAVTLAEFMVLGIEATDALRSLRLRLSSRMADLDKPMLSARYAGTTLSIGATAEGDETLAGQLKQYVFGQCTGVAGRLVNKFNVLYQFAANPGGVAAIVPYDGALPIEVVADFPALSSLVAATLEPGTAATCKAQGIVRYESEPAFTVTADVTEGASLAQRSAARVIQRMLALVPTVAPGDIDTASFDAMHAYNPAEVGIVISDETTTLEAAGDVAASVLGSVVSTAAGMLTAVWNAGPAVAADKVLTLRELLDGAGLVAFPGPSSEGRGQPAWRIVVEWGRVWHPMATGDFAPLIAEATEGADLARKQLLSQEVRTATAEDAAVKVAFPGAVELVIRTHLTQSAPAAALAALCLSLFKVRRDRFAWPTFHGDGNVELGRTVTVRIPNRLGLTAGKNMIVVGRNDNRLRRTKTLELWG